MKHKKSVLIFLLILVALVSSLPVLVTLCQAAETIKVIHADPAKKLIVPTETIESSQPKETEKQTEKDDAADSSLSTGMIISISAGAAILIGGAIALGASSGGEGSPPTPVPPTIDDLVGFWHGEGNQPGSGRTYTATYHLSQGGGISYNILVNDGSHLVGSGSWKIVEYTLSIHTDHGSRYIGNFTPGNITSITLNANNGWTLRLTR